MDLLGSILNSMDKPPSVNSKEKLRLKKQQEDFLKAKDKERAKLNSFKDSVQKKINNFVEDGSQERLKFPPMDQIFRGVVHEIAEDADLSACSFGEEGVDRYIMVFKKECAPSEDELAALRRGEEWSEEKAKQLALQREQEKLIEEEDLLQAKNKKKFVPQHNYQEKYKHLIGLEAAKDAAKKTETNKQYGIVPSENKKDSRSIEQTLADIQSKKRLKTSHEGASSSCNQENS